jgi:hypothetical protein
MLLPAGSVKFIQSYLQVPDTATTAVSLIALVGLHKRVDDHDLVRIVQQIVSDRI